VPGGRNIEKLFECGISGGFYNGNARWDTILTKIPIRDPRQRGEAQLLLVPATWI